MRPLLTVLLLFVALASYGADPGKVVKVLPFFVDKDGNIAKSPSLFDRDAYQAYLHVHTNEVNGIRYDVLWKTSKVEGEKVAVRMELRGALDGNLPKTKTLETEAAPGKTGDWTEVKFVGDEYKSFGPIVAWRATLWSGTNQVGEQKSFLW
ncbi:MAG TPA: hypothetical protein VG347_25590 [Verrucomicrobiae bacterium]|nr:hypothetical protein [Verrucomicrobiae bacterium]